MAKKAKEVDAIQALRDRAEETLTAREDARMELDCEVDELVKELREVISELEDLVTELESSI